MPVRQRGRRRRGAPFSTLGDLEAAARAAVSSTVWGYIEGGSGDERTLAANQAAYGKWVIRPRALRGIDSVDLRTTVLGNRVSAPFYLSPTAYQREVHPDGERGSFRAAARAGVLAVLSTLSSDTLERVATASPNGVRWFQLYLQPEWTDSVALVQRAEAAGYSAIVLTVDTPLLGPGDRQLRSGFAMSRAIATDGRETAVSPGRKAVLRHGVYDLERATGATWEILGRLRRSTRLPLVVKGLLTADDAREAVARGVRGIIVSNHGGRQLDRAAAALDALPEIVEAVGRRAEVYVDGGARRGSDLLIALALGARAVGLGRPPLWALAAGGSKGVDRYLTLLATELALCLALAGRRSVSEIDRTMVAPASE